MREHDQKSVPSIPQWGLILLLLASILGLLACELLPFPTQATSTMVSTTTPMVVRPTDTPALEPTITARPTATAPLPTISPTATKKTTLQNMPIAVGQGMGSEWFESWATEDDIMVFFDDNFDQIPELRKGKIGWNVPSFAHVIETESEWSGKIDVIVYDYEMWDKTPEEEKRNPDWASQRAHQFADERNCVLIQGSSWNMVTDKDPDIFWGKVDKEKLQAIAKNVDNYGFNATGLRKESPEGYIEWFKTCSDYAREVNPDIKLWVMLDARNQSAEEMYDMIKQLEDHASGITIMGNEKEIISEFISKIRQQ